MKRAKVMLIAITIVAAVGGALAFKAQRFADKNVWCATNINGITCTKVDFKTVPVGAPSVTTPCLISHAALILPTTSYFTTSTCPQLTTARVTATIVE